MDNKYPKSVDARPRKGIKRMVEKVEDFTVVEKSESGHYHYGHKLT